MNDMEKFDITGHIKRRVREVLIESIPDEVLDKAIKAEYDKYFKPLYHNAPSKFEVQVHELLKEMLEKDVKAWLEDNFTSVWAEDSRMKLIGETVAKLIPVVQQHFMTQQIETALGALRTQLL
jgi:hypothetical protein